MPQIYQVLERLPQLEVHMEVKGWWAGETEEKRRPVDISYDGNWDLNDWSSGWSGDRGFQDCQSPQAAPTSHSPQLKLMHEKYSKLIGRVIECCRLPIT